MPVKKTHQEFLNQLQLRNQNNPNAQIGIQSGQTYQSLDKHMVFTCLNNHVDFLTRPRYVLLKHSGCPICGKLTTQQKNTTTHQDFEIALLERNKKYDPVYVVDGEKYKTVHAKIKFRCDNNHDHWTATPSSILRGHGCPACGAIKLKSMHQHTHGHFEEMLNQHNLKYPLKQVLIAPNQRYIKQSIKMSFVCLQEHKWDTLPGDIIHRNIGCPICAASKTFSHIAIDWLTTIEKQQNITIIHRGNNQKEFVVPGTNFKVDGFCEQTNTIYEFYGNYWHGNPRIFDGADINERVGKSFSELYLNTINREQRLIQLGYNIVTIWEDEYYNAVSPSKKTQVLSLLKDKQWLEQKLITEQYSCSRLAKELGTTRTTVEKYRVLHRIEQVLSQKELTTINYKHKTPEQKAAIKAKREQKNLELYGATNTFQSHKEKIVDVMKEKYGVEKPLQSPTMMKKKEATMIERYGVAHAMQNPEIFSQHQQHFVDTYGKNPGSLPENVQRAKTTNHHKFGCEHVNQSHLSKDTLEKLNNREWLIEQHHTQKKTLSQISNELKCWMTTVHKYCKKYDVTIKYYYESAQQREVSDWLKSQGVLVETNIRGIINGELDIYLPKYNVAIEYCGVFLHSDAHDRMTPQYHLNKLKQCREKGVRLITLYEDEWLYKCDIVKQKILNILNKDTSLVVYARKCTIEPVSDKNLKQQFFDINHIQGDGPGSITYGLKHNDQIVAMMTFIKTGTVFVLNRYASSSRVVGGFQKLLKYFQQQHQYTEIVSFADLRWSEGNVYFKSGFILDKTLLPDYRYVIGNKTYHKFGFRRKNLPKILGDQFDPSLSETKNMNNAGYHRIWNCGLLRFVKSNIQP